ncbi:MAG: arginine--tRNA ligase [Clostridiales bacterium]|nr:arginine--tRNA ligase [Clostridiales bacterium]MCF8022525.1 arginine--tRNA ligase [Clostridiales bacterium]
MHLVEKIRKGLCESLEEAVKKSIASGELPPVEIPDFYIEVPREKQHGDFAVNLAMMLAKPARNSPRKIAEILVDNLNTGTIPVESVEIAGPGFINFYINPLWVLEGIPAVLTEGENYGRVNLGKNKKAQVEFVSANPTGLLHMGNARGAALGDSLASILDFAGYEVQREYYINDAGKQIENFGTSLETRYFQQLGWNVDMPEDGYHGDDIIDTVKLFLDKYGDKYASAPEKDRRDALIEFALHEKKNAISNALSQFRVKYDVWFSEQSLHDEGKVAAVVEQLKERGCTYVQDGALWFRAADFGLEKDEVLLRQNGIPTYFTADAAYHMNKFQRGFNTVINIWGADHHGHVARMKSVISALGYDSEALQVVIMQLVRLYRGGEMVRMSKRTGQFITLEELVEEVGTDAARYFFIMRSADSHLDFDLDLAKSQTNENPVYYIQYAHARICSILRQPGVTEVKEKAEQVDISSLLYREAELALARRLVDFPEEISLAAGQMSPHRVARYLHEVAGLLHSFYNAYRVITSDSDLSAARVKLVKAARIVLQNGLNILGINAPEKM